MAIYFNRIPAIPLTNVSPFTHRDGTTYLQILRELREVIVRVADAQVDLDGKMDTRISQMNALLDSLETQVQAAIEGITETGDKYLPEMENLYSSLRQLADEIEPLIETSNRLDQEITARQESDNALVASIVSVNERVDYGARLFPHHYGAVGDGVKDDTEALRDWLADGGVTMEPGRVYHTTGPLQLEGDHKTINGNHARLHFEGDDTLESHAIKITGDHAEVSNLTILGGQGGIATGIWVNGAFSKIHGNRIMHLHDVAGAQGIHVEGHTGGHMINDNTIHDIVAIGDGVIASGSGLARGIMFYNGPDRVHMKYESTISGNRISSIIGEEGNHIGVFGLPITDISEGHANSKVTIVGNTMDDASRRGIKIQASEVTVKGNTIRDSHLGNSANPSAVIDVINSKNVTIDGNSIYTGDLRGIAGHGDATSLYRFTVTNNMIQIPVINETDGVGTAIFTNGSMYFNISNNITYGGNRAISTGRSTAGIVQGNTINQLKLIGSNTRAIAIIEGNDRVNMRNNVYNRLQSGGVINPFENESDNGFSSNNVESFPQS